MVLVVELHVNGVVCLCDYYFFGGGGGAWGGGGGCHKLFVQHNDFNSS